MKVQAVIFDMDGLLIDTEPLWRTAEVNVFTKLGATITHDECRETMGLRLDEAVKYWYEKKRWESSIPLKEVEAQIVDDLVGQVRNSGTPKEGVAEIIKFFQSEGIRMCIASSSSSLIINEVVKCLNIGSALEFTHSAEFEPFGKPHPAVFLSTLRKLNLPPSAVLVFEDSARGVAAATAAGIQTIGVPEHDTDPGELIRAGADLVIASLRNFSKAHLMAFEA